MTDTELNESLLKKIGFKPCVNGTWRAPDKSGYFGPLTVPDLLHDLNACFRWLVPELRKRRLTSIEIQYHVTWLSVDISGCGVLKSATGAPDEVSLALCLAADKFLR